jgi:hypothetical protein
MSQMPPNNPFSDMPDKNPYQSPLGPTADPKSNPPMQVKNYLVESILLLICCAGIFAIPAIVYAAQVNAKLNSGDYHGALESSNNAKKWCIIALCIGLTCNGAILLIQLGVIAAGAGGAGGGF